MDVSILNHIKDSSPRQMAVAKVVELIRSSQWPPGYQPLLIVSSVVQGGRQRKHVRWLTGLSIARIGFGSEQPVIKSEKLETARSDPHTLLCWSDGRDGVYVVYGYELNDGYSKEQQIRYHGRVTQWAGEYYEQLMGGKADRTCVGATKAVPLCHDPDAFYQEDAMPFLSADISGKAKSTEQQNNGGKTVTNSEVKEFLKTHVALRRNEVTSRVEYRELDTDEWRPINDVRQNTLWDEMSNEMAGRTVDYRTVDRIINSDFSPPFHPFRTYLDSLPPWDGESDAILALSVTVQVKGGHEKQMLFYECLKKWLVAMVAGWVDEEVVNHSVLVLLGRQGIYKTTWFTYLLPPELRQYFYTKTNGSQMTRDDKLVLAKYGLVCCEELDTMNPWEMNQLKSLITTRYIDERGAYERYHEHREHIASFCGTGNNVQFLSDSTGTRRWLPFEVESIASPRDLPFDYEGIYSQAYALYLQDFPYYFSDVETERLKDHNNEYEVSNVEEELIEEYFRLPSEKDAGEFIRTAVALQIVSSPGVHVSAIGLGRAFSKLGFQRGVQGRSRGYYAVRIPPEERKRRAVSQALEARLRKND